MWITRHAHDHVVLCNVMLLSVPTGFMWSVYSTLQGPFSISKCHLTSMGNTILEIKIMLQLSYLQNEISHIGKTKSSYCIRANCIQYNVWTFIQWYSVMMILCNMQFDAVMQFLPYWGWVMHICVGNLTIIGSDNGLSPGRRQTIFWINAGILLIGPLGTNFSEILIAMQTFSF